ncbi:MAG TPA: nitrate reductase molybdenum cofactor assembly chaperone [Burkholderiaceae bacterium]
MQKHSIALILRVLARLLSYPDAELRAHLPDLRQALSVENALAAGSLHQVEALIAELEQGDDLEAEETYVKLFDQGRATSLHLFEHVHGDSRDRGPAMIDLAQTYEAAGLYLKPGELPDYLPALLEFASTQPPAQAVGFLAETAHILNALHSALLERKSAYAALINALLELSGERTQPVESTPDVPIDASWSEPPTFDGCSAQGQAKPGGAQPIQFVRTAGNQTRVMQ